jgi:hypothetical protein
MTYWRDLEPVPVPEPDDGWDRPTYDELAALAPEDLLTVAWNLWGHYSDTQFQCLDFAQDLSFEFEVMGGSSGKEAGLEFMRRAYSLAGFSEKRREQIAEAADELRMTGRTVLGAERISPGSETEK